MNSSMYLLENQYRFSSLGFFLKEGRIFRRRDGLFPPLSRCAVCPESESSDAGICTEEYPCSLVHMLFGAELNTFRLESGDGTYELFCVGNRAGYAPFIDYAPWKDYDEYEDADEDGEDDDPGFWQASKGAPLHHYSDTEEEDECTKNYRIVSYFQSADRAATVTFRLDMLNGSKEYSLSTEDCNPADCAHPKTYRMFANTLVIGVNTPDSNLSAAWHCHTKTHLMLTGFLTECAGDWWPHPFDGVLYAGEVEEKHYTMHFWGGGTREVTRLLPVGLEFTLEARDPRHDWLADRPNRSKEGYLWPIQEDLDQVSAPDYITIGSFACGFNHACEQAQTVYFWANPETTVDKTRNAPVRLFGFTHVHEDRPCWQPLLPEYPPSSENVVTPDPEPVPWPYTPPPGPPGPSDDPPPGPSDDPPPGPSGEPSSDGHGNLFPPRLSVAWHWCDAAQVDYDWETGEDVYSDFYWWQSEYFVAEHNPALDPGEEYPQWRWYSYRDSEWTGYSFSVEVDPATGAVIGIGDPGDPYCLNLPEAGMDTYAMPAWLVSVYIYEEEEE